MAVHRFDPETARDVSGLVNGDDLDIPSIVRATGEIGRWRALVAMIKGVACRAQQCCEDAKAAAVVDPGAFAFLTCDGETQNLNVDIPAAMKWDRTGFASSEYTVSSNPMSLGRVAVSVAAWYRIYTTVSFKGLVADGSLKVSVSAGGVTLDGKGQHGVIRNANGHTASSSSIESFALLNPGDTISILTARNGAAGVLTPIAAESVLIIERRPYPVT